MILNADLIEFIERTPDTLISLITGKKVMVKESVEDVIRQGRGLSPFDRQEPAYVRQSRQ